LSSTDKIVIDGKLDEQAWLDVTWSEPFMDIQGLSFPTPRFETRMKIRWDDEWLYVGGYVQEPQVWANQTKHDSVIFQDNDFEFFADPDGSTHYYKEFEINAINTNWDLMLDRAYIDGGNPNATFDMPTMQTGTYVKGPVNNPAGGPDQWWTVELALPLKDYVVMCSWATAPPHHGDLWRINFSRVEYYVMVVNNQYEKVPGVPLDNWVWQNQRAIAMHLPERWGYLQFSRDPVNATQPIQDPRWPQLQALIQVFYAEHEYSAVNGYFVDDLSFLEIPAWVLDGSCGTGYPTITATDYNFQINVTSTSLPLVGHILNDRFTSFSSV
jgi:hypothetical protein